MSAGTGRATTGLAERETDFVQSLQRGLAVIRAFDADHPTLTLSDVARATGLARAAARRFLLTLVDLGYIRVDGRQFRLSPRVLELGRAYLSSLTLPEIALPHLRQATDELRESSSLAVLDGTDIVYVAHAPAKRILSISIDIGTRDVAFATSLGRVLLAGQDDDWLDDYLATVELPAITPRTINTPDKLRTELLRIRRQGWAFVDQELEDGLRAIAAPIHDEHGNVVAAANLAVHASRWSNDAIRNTLLPRLLHTTTAIDQEMHAAAGPAAGPAHETRRSGSGDRPGAAVVMERETDFVQSLQRGLAVIRAFDADHPTLTLSDVARATGLARAAARRFLLTLVDLGYIRVDGRQFRLSPRVLELGRPYLSSLTLPEIALPHLRQATDELRESSSLAVLDGTDIVYVAHAPAKRILSISIDIGTRDVAFATSLGRVLLAGQDDDWLDDYLATVELPAITPRTINTPDKLRTELLRIRRQGWAFVDQELEDGLRAIAAPIHDEHGNVVAAANLAVHASRWSNDAIRNTLLPRLLHTTAAIDQEMHAAAVAPGVPPPTRGGSG